jgi:hypothetical protein
MRTGDRWPMAEGRKQILKGRIEPIDFIEKPIEPGTAFSQKFDCNSMGQVLK